MELEEDTADDEFTADSIIHLLQHHPLSLEVINKLASLSASGEIRDYDELFSDVQLYVLSANLLSRCWHDYDLHHLMGDESQHELFLLSVPRVSRGHSGVDDEEDEAGQEVLTQIGTREQADTAWQQLQSVYRYLSHLFSCPEFNGELASSVHAFDARLCSDLINRFEPKLRKKSQQEQYEQQQQKSQPLTNAQLLTIVGVGGTPQQQQHLATVPASILASVGVGLGARQPDPDAPTAAELALLRGLLHSVYHSCVIHRKHLLSLIAGFFQRFIRQPVFPQGISELLSVYGATVKGYKFPLLSSRRVYLMQNIMPLHMPNNMQNELTPTIQQYHEQLVYVIIQYMKKEQQQQQQQQQTNNTNNTTATTTNTASTTTTTTDATASPATTTHAASSSPSGVVSPPSLLRILSSLLTGWPPPRQPNSAKEVLLLHELEQLLEFGSVEAFAAFTPDFLPYLLSAVSSSHHRVSERCLQLWQNDHWLALIHSQRRILFPALIPILLQEKHWNKSVNKMRVLVLETCQQQDAVLHRECIHQLYQKPTVEESLQAAAQMVDAMRPPPDVNESMEDTVLRTQVHVPATITHVEYKDFVFGHLLGSGSFSQVRYAKKIIKSALPSSWPEYAIKIVNKQLIRQQQYEANVQREMQIMSLFHHPNVNTLIATCENEHHLYFVCEYAKKGDLFTHLSALGSFDVQTARFISAEILRGLEDIHSHGVIWGDCKPENVLVHQSGHVKLTDFGSARYESEISTADRIEGTEDYLAPEILRGTGAMSQASDLWSFACVLYQLLAGRTPIWAGATERTKKKDRHKAKQHTPKSKHDTSPKPSHSPNQAYPSPSSSDADRSSMAAQKAAMISKMVQFESLTDKFPENFDPVAKELIAAILTPAPSERYAIQIATTDITPTTAASTDTPTRTTNDPATRYHIDYTLLKGDPFFGGIEWDILHTLPAPSLSSGGAVAPAPEAKWARRKNSLMWAPMPKTYSFNDSQFIMETITEDDRERQAELQTIADKNKQASATTTDNTNTTEGGDNRMKYIGYKPDDKIGAVAEGREEEEGEEEEDVDEMSDRKNGLLHRMEADSDEDEEEEHKQTSRRPIRHSSRFQTSTDSTIIGAAPLPPTHPITPSKPPRPRIGIHTLPQPSASTASGPVPNASPLVGVNIPGITHSGPLPKGNPTAASLLARVLGQPNTTNPPANKQS